MEGVAVRAGQADLVGVPGTGNEWDQALAAERAVGTIEPESVEGPVVEVEPVLVRDRVVIGRTEPVGVFRVFLGQLCEPAVDVAGAFPL